MFGLSERFCVAKIIKADTLSVCWKLYPQTFAVLRFGLRCNACFTSRILAVSSTGSSAMSLEKLFVLIWPPRIVPSHFLSSSRLLQQKGVGSCLLQLKFTVSINFIFVEQLIEIELIRKSERNAPPGYGFDQIGIGL